MKTETERLDPICRQPITEQDIAHDLACLRKLLAELEDRDLHPGVRAGIRARIERMR